MKIFTFRLVSFACILSLFPSCAPTSLEELRCEGEVAVKQLTLELKRLESQEDVQNVSKRLKKHFNRLAELLLATRHFPVHKEELPEMAGAEDLFVELARLYEIPGVRALIETAQNEAVRRLDRGRFKSI